MIKAASPACTELEIIMLDWVGNMIGLPEDFLCYSHAKSKGGGVIQVSYTFIIYQVTNNLKTIIFLIKFLMFSKFFFQNWVFKKFKIDQTFI